ncbi:hypothetical protein U9M48_011982 [Paspalum notatum var. saurae]|uniref:F-box domain-containing protein n=1 Tax=Paspalum notatum var. saurae TaxID=547442 RepID=A0AAQ3SX43_PASNO
MLLRPRLHRKCPAATLHSSHTGLLWSGEVPPTSPSVPLPRRLRRPATAAADCAERSEAAVVASLPDDPLVDILSRVPSKSLCRFKCVSKSWRGLIADPVHREKLPQTLEGFFFLGDSGGDEGGDGEDSGSDGDYLPLQAGRFVDALGRSVRPADACFPFLTELPGIHHIWLKDHCNGLLLFGYIEESDKSLNYIVSNPATKQWVAVPGSHKKSSSWRRVRLISLVFDPAVSPHFHLVQFKEGPPPAHIYLYSSESGAWRTIRSGGLWGYLLTEAGSPSAYADGVLYVTLHDVDVHIVAIDVEGNIKLNIPVPLRAGDKFWPLADYVGRSQGCLHYIYHADPECDDEGPPENPEKQSYQLFIWVLEDYEKEQWILKDTVSFIHLFGKKSCQVGTDYNVVGIHPDASLVYVVQHWDHKLISYHMDTS